MRSGEIKLKISICDDEEFFLEKINRLTEQYFNHKGIMIEVKCYQDVEEFLQSDFVTNHIIFLDVKMEKRSGMEAAYIVREKNKHVPIIFISAHVEFAVEGYFVKAFHYLLKNDLEETYHIVMDELLAEMRLQYETIELKVENEKIPIKLSDIIYMESFKRYIVFHMAEGAYKQYGKISDFEEKLSEKGFLRIHKSYLVNLAHVEKIKNKEVYLSSDEILPCSKGRYSEIQHKYLVWRGK